MQALLPDVQIRLIQLRPGKNDPNSFDTGHLDSRVIRARPALDGGKQCTAQDRVRNPSRSLRPVGEFPDIQVSKAKKRLGQFGFHIQLEALGQLDPALTLALHVLDFR
ncbi:hypothetical protein D3C84_896980 [compost metagenome]